MDDQFLNNPQQSEDVHNEETDPEEASLPLEGQPEEYGTGAPIDADALHNTDTFNNPEVGSMTTAEIEDQAAWQEHQQEQAAGSSS